MPKAGKEYCTNHLTQKEATLIDKKPTKAENANQKLNQEFYSDENHHASNSKTEKANKKLQERLESGEPSKGVNPDQYLNNNENSLVTKGQEKK
ncbi:hypothetical protein [Bacillus sp. AK031]